MGGLARIISLERFQIHVHQHLIPLSPRAGDGGGGGGSAGLGAPALTGGGTRRFRGTAKRSPKGTARPSPNANVIRASHLSRNSPVFLTFATASSFPTTPTEPHPQRPFSQQSQRIELRAWIEEHQDVSRYRDTLTQTVLNYLAEKNLLAPHQPRQPTLKDSVDSDAVRGLRSRIKRSA